MLEPVYLARLDWRRVMTTLEARLAASQDPDERRQLLRRLAKLHEEQEEDYRAALETTAKLLAEDLTDEATWAELERLARVANAEARLAEIYAGELEKVASDEPATARLAKRTGELFEAQKDVDRALSFYRRAHAFEPGGEARAASRRSIACCARPAARRERVKLYRDALDYKTDPTRPARRAPHDRAARGGASCHDDAAAIDTYRAALDVDEADSHALEALSRLYARSERWRDLAELTRRRAEQSALPEDEARFRIELAQLLVEKLGETRAGDRRAPGGGRARRRRRATGPGAEAVEALEALLHAPEHKARVVDILRPIYERADDWRHLVAVNERAARARDRRRREDRDPARDRAALGGAGRRPPAGPSTRCAQAWTLDPEDGEARERARAPRRGDQALGRPRGRLRDGDRRRPTASTKRELLSALAQLHDKRRDDPRRALRRVGAAVLPRRDRARSRSRRWTRWRRSSATGRRSCAC